MAKRRVTLHDIANHLGLNTSTVSRALSDSNSKISVEVVREIKATAQRLGYKQNAAAYALKVGSTKTIGIIIPDLMNPVFPPIIRGVQTVLDQYGYTLLLSYSENNKQLAMTEVDKLISRGVDGIVYATAFREDPVVQMCHDNNVPIVLVNRSSDASLADTVKVDDTSGIGLAFEHLFELGHRKIGMISGPKTMSVSTVRRRSFEQCMHDKGLEIPEYGIVEADSFSELAGELATASFLANYSDSTALIASNDLLALGSFRAMSNIGLECPERMSIVGYNNMPYLDWFATPLTTVAIPHFKMGERAAEILIRRVTRGLSQDDIEDVLLKPRLIVRHSTAKVPSL